MFKIKQTMNEKELLEAIELDKENFPYPLVCNFDECIKWIQKNDNIHTLIIKDEKLVGYINFMPIKTEFYDMYRAGKMQEDEITADHIEVYEDGKSYDILLMAIAIKKKYRSGWAILTLMKGLRQKLEILEERGIIIKRILSDCVTEDGVKSALRMGFKYIGKSKYGKLYEGGIENLSHPAEKRV